MKRTLLLLLAAALLPAFGASAFSLVKSDREKEDLKGQVKTVKEYNLRKAEYFHADTLAKYRRLGKPLPEYERTLNAIHTYDIKGRKIVEDDPILERKTVNSYNPDIKNCMLAEVSDTYFIGELTRRYAFTIGADGIPVSAIATDAFGKTIFTETFTATRDGDKTNVRCRHVNADGAVSTQDLVLRPDHSISSLAIEEGQKRQKFGFNEDELPTEIIIDTPYQKIHQVIVQSPGKQVSYAVAPDGSHKLVRQALLDSNGNPYEIDRYDDNGNLVEITSFIYIYDSHGNWIKRSKFVNSNSASEIMEREITYY